MGDVVKFSRKEDLVWVCCCGCRTHFLRVDGLVECAACENIIDSTGEWRKRVPDPPEGEIATIDSTNAITRLDSAEAAIKRVLKKADPDKLIALITIQDDGHVSCWSQDLEGEEQIAWLHRRLMEDAFRMMTEIPSEKMP